MPPVLQGRRQPPSLLQADQATGAAARDLLESLRQATFPSPAPPCSQHLPSPLTHCSRGCLWMQEGGTCLPLLLLLSSADPEPGDPSTASARGFGEWQHQARPGTVAVMAGGSCLPGPAPRLQGTHGKTAREQKRLETHCCCHPQLTQWWGSPRTASDLVQPRAEGAAEWGAGVAVAVGSSSCSLLLQCVPPLAQGIQLHGDLGRAGDSDNSRQLPRFQTLLLPACPQVCPTVQSQEVQK